MRLQHVRAARLKVIAPTAGCCDCANEVDMAPDDEVWTILDGKRVYCPACARNGGIGAE